MAICVENVRESLRELARDFEGDAERNRELIRGLLERDPAGFRAAAVEILRSPQDLPGAEHVLSLLAAERMLLDALCDPTLPMEQAVALARAAVRADSNMEGMLARQLADSAVGQGETLRDPARAMEIVAQVADFSRIMPSLMRMLRHPNPHVRSRLVKMIGRGCRSLQWVKGKLSETDARVRANAVEALWGVDAVEARALLSLAKSDSNNRVLGNALLGLYYAGECSVLEEIVRMSAHDSKLYRATAAWVMGMAADVRFTGIVRRLLVDTEGMVRKHALAAIGRINQANQAAGEGKPLHVAARLLASSHLQGQRRLMVAVVDEEAKPQRVAPLEFILTEGERYVTSYRVLERPEPKAFSVTFVIPRAEQPDAAMPQAVRSCLQWKRAGDSWCVLPYLEDDESGWTAHLPTLPRLKFSTAPADIEKWLGAPAERSECADLWTAVTRAAQGEGMGLTKRHVVVLSGHAGTGQAARGLPANLRGGNTEMCVVSARRNPELEEFCRRTQSRYVEQVNGEIAEAVRGVYLGLLARYEISYLPLGEGPIRVSVRSEVGLGETSVGAG